MTKNQFQTKYSEKLSKFLESEEGKAFFLALSVLKVPYGRSKKAHLFAEENGARRGYETCLVEILSLSQPPRPQAEDIQVTYGVPDRKPDEKK